MKENKPHLGNDFKNEASFEDEYGIFSSHLFQIEDHFDRENRQIPNKIIRTDKLYVVSKLRLENWFHSYHH